MWGPIFVGALVRPNMLNMPKSTSDNISDNDQLKRKLIGRWAQLSHEPTTR